MMTSMYIKSMCVCLRHNDGQIALVKSPEITKKIGIRMKFGWLVAIIGFFIMFGHYKEWKTIYNPTEQEKNG